MVGPFVPNSTTCVSIQKVFLDFILTLNRLNVKFKPFMVGPYPAMVKLGPCVGRRVIPFVKNVYDQIQMLHKDDVCLDVSAGNETLGGYVMAKKCQCSNNEIRPNQLWSLDYTNNVEAARKRPASRKAIDPKDDDEESAESTEGPDTIDDYDSNESSEKPDPNAIPYILVHNNSKIRL